MRKPHKMVNHTQTIRRLLLTNFFSVFDHFVGLALKGLRVLNDKQLNTTKRKQFPPVTRFFKKFLSFPCFINFQIYFYPEKRWQISGGLEKENRGESGLVIIIDQYSSK